MKIHCYKVNGQIKPITYIEFVHLYKDKKKGQQDWQYCKEQIQKNPKKFNDGKLFEFNKNGLLFYFCHNINKNELSNILKSGTNQISKARQKVDKIITPYINTKEKLNVDINMYIKEIYPADYLLKSKVGDYILKYIDKKRQFINLDGDDIKITSTSLRLFKTKGIKCIKCGLEGKWFYKCRQKNELFYHLELFGEKDGKLVLMTKDHIMPLSNGGADHLANLQTMCLSCNANKGNVPNIKDRMNGLSKEELCVSKLNAIVKLCQQEYNSNHLNKQELIKEIFNIIHAKTDKKLDKDKSILNKLGKIIGIK